MLDRAKLAKLLALTVSDNDGEAINAMRLANKLVKQAGLDWEQALAPPPAVQVVVRGNRVDVDLTPRPGGMDHAEGAHLSNENIIGIMFKAVLSQQRIGNTEFWAWVDDIKEKFDKHGRLTQGQYDALRRSYSRAVRR